MSSYGVFPQGGWLTSSFIKPHYSEIKCLKREDSTHLRLVGGKYHITDALNEQFLAAYSKDLGDSDVRHCLTEVCTELFPFFIDFDVFDSSMSLADASTPEVKAQMAGWCQTAISCINKCLGSHDLNSSEEEEAASAAGAPSVSALQRTKAIRDKLPPAASVLMTAPPRTVTKGELTGTKLGLHLMWPTLIVSKPSAQRLRNLVVISLHGEYRGRAWDDIVDSAVYRPMASLRMIGSFKVTKCAACDVPEIKAARKEESAQRSNVAAILGLSSGDAANAYAVRRSALQGMKTLEQHHPHKSLLQSYCSDFDKSHNCQRCKGNFRIPDIPTGVYSLQAVVDSDGDLLSDITDSAMNDPFLAVYLCSPRRSADVAPTALIFPKHSPAAPKAVITPRVLSAQEAEDNDLNSITDDLVQLQLRPADVPGAKRLEKASCIGSEQSSCLLLETWLHSAFGKAYDAVQVASAYRLITKGVPDRGKPEHRLGNYIVIATLRGYGSQYCCNVKRDHTSNHVYFELHSNGTAVQKCHSTNNPGCTKPCTAPIAMPARVFTAFYPFAKRTLLVLPEEIADWISGKMTKEALVHNVGPIYGCTRKDGGVTFTNILQTARRRQMRAYLKETSGGAILGKRSRESDGAEDDDALQADEWQFADQEYC